MRERCHGTTKAGERCKRMGAEYCFQHRREKPVEIVEADSPVPEDLAQAAVASLMPKVPPMTLIDVGKLFADGVLGRFSDWGVNEAARIAALRPAISAASDWGIMSAARYEQALASSDIGALSARLTAMSEVTAQQVADLVGAVSTSALASSRAQIADAFAASPMGLLQSQLPGLLASEGLARRAEAVLNSRAWAQAIEEELQSEPADSVSEALHEVTEVVPPGALVRGDAGLEVSGAPTMLARTQWRVAGLVITGEQLGVALYLFTILMVLMVISPAFASALALALTGKDLFTLVVKAVKAGWPGEE